MMVDGLLEEMVVDDVSCRSEGMEIENFLIAAVVRTIVA